MHYYVVQVQGRLVHYTMLYRSRGDWCITLCCTGPWETGAAAEPDKQLAGGETVMRMLPTGQPQMPYHPGMPMIHMRPGMPPNFRGMMMPFVSITPSVCLHL